MALAWGPAAAGAAQGLSTGIGIARDLQLARVRDLQIQEAEREAAEQQAYRALIPRVLASAPETAVVGGAPAGITWPSAEEGSGAVITPPRPGTTVSGRTMGSLTRDIGPEGMASVIARPEGRALLREQGVMTDEQFQTKKRRAEALEEFRKFGEEMESKYSAGDPLGAILAERAGYRALAAAVDDPSPLLTKANDLTKEYARAFDRQRKDEQYKKDLETDGQAYAKAMSEYRAAARADAEARAKGQPASSATTKLDALVGTLAGMKTEPFQKKRDVLFQKLEEGVARQVENEPVSRLYGSVGAIMNQQIERGQSVDYKGALREAFRQNPDAVGPFIETAIAHKTPMSEVALEALGIKGTPKNEYEEAHQLVVAGDPSTGMPGIPAADPRYIPAFTAALTRIKKARAEATRAPREPGQDQALDRLVNLRGQKQQQLRDAKRILTTRDVTEDDAAEARLEIDELSKDIKKLDDQIQGRMRGIPPKEKPAGPGPETAAAPGAPAAGAKKKPDPEKIKVTTQQIVRRMFPGKDWALDEAALAAAKTDIEKRRVQARVLTSDQKKRILAEVNRRLGLTEE